jgi:Carboxypeptidase regulatory-like domain
MKWTRIPFSILALYAALTAGSRTSLMAQSGVSSALSGIVTDATGATVPGATVTATYISTRAQRTATTGADGTFLFLQLSAGNYRVAAQASGFATSAQDVTYSGVPIRLNFKLVTGAVQTQVIVNAHELDPTEPAHVDITPEQIERIPSQSVSSPLSSLLTLTTPGVSADSNGSFHPLGDHAEASFVIDGQPITDQQSRTFSTQISLNALQSMEVREGSPLADVGDKTSMVIVAQTRSGLDQRRPTGALSFSRGSFATTQASGNVGFGTTRFGSFSAVDGMNSGRFLDTPELVALHANGNAQNLIERLDYKVTPKTSLQLNTSLSRSWFQIPNTLDQQALGQNQRQTVASFNVAPSMLHTFNSSAFNQTNLWVREDKIRYWPSADPLADTPATLAQARRLTNGGIRDEVTYSHGRHTAVAGAEWKHTFLSEQFTTGLTGPAYNSPCLGPDGAPSPETTYSDPSQCAPAGLAVNPGFLPGLMKIDLTRGGTLFNFRGHTDIKQEAIFAQDSIRLGNFTLNPGLRFDNYNGLTKSNAFQPRVGGAYTAQPLHTVFHLAYSRVFLTPYNENLIVASSSGPGSTAGTLGAVDSAVLNTGRRNQFNVGFETQVSKLLSFSGEYLWKFTYGAYDFDVLLNSPLTFPTQFRKSKIDGALFRVTIAPTHGFAGYLTMSHVRSRLFGPETGGVSFSPPYSNVARPDHDEGLAMNLYTRYQIGHRGPWAGISYRYDGGLVAVAIPDYATALRLTGDEQGQMGLHCGMTFASALQPIRSCAGRLGATRIRVPPAGTENDDRNPPRIALRSVVNLSIGQDDLFRHERQSLGLRLDVVNLANVDGLYNFLSTFSGTHFMTPRSVTGQIHYTF